MTVFRNLMQSVLYLLLAVFSLQGFATVRAAAPAGGEPGHHAVAAADPDEDEEEDEDEDEDEGEEEEEDDDDEEEDE